MLLIYFFLVLFVFYKKIHNSGNDPSYCITPIKHKEHQPKTVLAEENNDLQYVSNMLDLLNVINSRERSFERNFMGIKDNALVFWRNYPEYINIDDHINSMNGIHLLDVKKMVREESKVCSVDGYRSRRNKTYCDKVHFCLGTVQHSWNMKLALEVLRLESGENTYEQGDGFGPTTHNAYYTDPTHCTKSICSGFEEDARYRCRPTNETKYEWFPNVTTEIFSAAFKNKKICFYGDSLSAGQSQTLENEMRSRSTDKSSTNMKKKYGNVSFNPSNKRAYYLNEIETFDKPLYKRAYTLYEGVFDDMLQDTNTCDIVILNSALFWSNPQSVQSVGRVQKFKFS